MYIPVEITGNAKYFSIVAEKSNSYFCNIYNNISKKYTDFFFN